MGPPNGGTTGTGINAASTPPAEKGAAEPIVPQEARLSPFLPRFNRRHRRSGHLYQGRFKAHLVEADGYARQLLKYIHLNPVRPKDKRTPIPVERREELAAYRWSSHPAYAAVAGVAAPA